MNTTPDLPEWAKGEWDKEPEEFDEESKVWLRTRPQIIKDLILQFPPECLVKAKDGMKLLAPPPGSYGYVASYRENGDVTVACPDIGVRGACRPEWLEVVCYLPGITPEVMKAALEEEKDDRPVD